MDIEKIASFLQNLNPVTLRPELCSKLITPKSSCTNCRKICPVQGITFTSNNIKVEECISCGLCIEACPNQVFKLNENRLLEIDNNQTPTLVLTCASLYQDIPEELRNCVTKISCLGELYPELTLYLLATFEKVIIMQNPNECAKCLPYSLAEKLSLGQFSNILDKYFNNKLLIINNINKIRPYLDTQKLKPAQDRRTFFKSIFAGSKNISKEILHSALNEEKPNEKVKPLKKHYLKEAFKKQKQLDYSASLPYPKLKLTACNFCGACCKLCPTDALKTKEEESEKVITFKPNLCTHCNICSDICFYQGLSWDRNLTIGEFLNDDCKILAQTEKKVCANCEQEFFELDEQETLCFLCRPVQNFKFL